MLNIKKLPKIKKSENSLEPKTKNILSIIGSPKQINNKKNLTNNKILKENNFKIIEKKTIENTVKNITSDQILHSKNDSIIDINKEEY